MKLNEAKADEKVKMLKSALKGEEHSTICSLAVAAFRYHHIQKNYPEASVKPVLRWYFGQLAREYIRKIYITVRADLEYLADIGLIEITEKDGNALKEFHLHKGLYTPLKHALESIIGKEQVTKVIEGAKYYKGMNSEHGQNKKKSEVVKNE